MVVKGINLFAWVFSLYQHIRIYSQITVLCNFFQIQSEDFFLYPWFFPQGFHVNLVFSLFHISLLSH